MYLSELDRFLGFMDNEKIIIDKESGNLTPQLSEHELIVSNLGAA